MRGFVKFAILEMDGTEKQEGSDVGGVGLPQLQAMQFGRVIVPILILAMGQFGQRLNWTEKVKLVSPCVVLDTRHYTLLCRSVRPT